MRLFNIIMITTALALTGCGDDHDDHNNNSHADGGVNVNEEGCEHLKKGPFVDVTGGADIKTAGEVKEDHKAYRVTIPAGAAGYVKFAAGDKGDHVIFLDAAVLFEVLDDQGKTVKLEKSETSIKECAEVKGKHTVDLPAVGTYYFKLGPSAAHAKVSLVIEGTGHAHP